MNFSVLKRNDSLVKQVVYRHFLVDHEAFLKLSIANLMVLFFWDFIDKNCSDVTCPELEPCPSDSYRLPALTSVDGCCVMNQKCICLPTCHPKNCTADTTPVIEVQSTGEPGQCCPLYKCVKTGKI